MTGREVEWQLGGLGPSSTLSRRSVEYNILLDLGLARYLQLGDGYLYDQQRTGKRLQARQGEGQEQQGRRSRCPLKSTMLRLVLDAAKFSQAYCFHRPRFLAAFRRSSLHFVSDVESDCVRETRWPIAPSLFHFTASTANTLTST